MNRYSPDGTFLSSTDIDIPLHQKTSTTAPAYVIANHYDQTFLHTQHSTHIHMVSDGVGQQMDLHRIPTTMDMASDDTWVIGYEDATFAIYQHNNLCRMSTNEVIPAIGKGISISIGIPYQLIG